MAKLQRQLLRVFGGAEPYKAKSALVTLSAEMAQVTVLKIPSLGMPGSKIGTHGKKAVMVDCLFPKSLE